MTIRVTPDLRKLANSKLKTPLDADESRIRKDVGDAVMKGTLSMDEVYAATVIQPGVSALDSHGTKAFSAGQVFGVGDPSARETIGNESYMQHKSIGNHAKTMQPVLNEKGVPCLLPSQAENAKAGVLFKMAAKKSGIQVSLNTQEKAILEDMFERDRWVGVMDAEFRKDISGMDVKALLSDSLSGGLHVNPEWFDMNLISFPLLSGELLPMVDMVEMPRGAAVEGASIGNPTVTWGTPSGTPAGLFDTDGLIAEINTSVHVVTAVVEVGRDFLADAAADIGRSLQENIGRRMAAELDKVIAIGDGTSQPEGIFTASGLGTVTTSGTVDVDAVEAFYFGIAKQYRQGSKDCAFVSNDTNYARVRGIPVDATNDARRIFGMDVSNYDGGVLGCPWRVQNDIANTKAAFGNMKKYRLYRRQGFEIQWLGTQDASLARANKLMLIVRGRFGGKVVDASAFARSTDMPA